MDSRTENSIVLQRPITPSEQKLYHILSATFERIVFAAHSYYSCHFMLSKGWKDWIGGAAINIVSTVGIGTTAILVGSGVIAAGLAPQITLPIAAASIGLQAGFIHYRSQKKKREYLNVVKTCSDPNTQHDIHSMIDNIITLYGNTINHLTENDIKTFAQYIADVLIYAMMKGKLESIKALHDRAYLQHILYTYAKNIKSHALQTTFAADSKRNTTSCILKIGIFCEENNMIYTKNNARPNKYGLIKFTSIKEFEDFKSLNAKQYKYFGMHKYQHKGLLRQTIFTEQPPSTRSSIAKNDSTYAGMQANARS